eukprot:1328419-Amorphochlora_amoeboformis.AAC.6
MSGELLGVLPSFFKGGLVKMIVDYACPESFLGRRSTFSTFVRLTIPINGCFQSDFELQNSIVPAAIRGVRP